MKKVLNKSVRGIFTVIQNIMKAKKVVFVETDECLKSLMVEELKNDCCDNIVCETKNIKPKITRGKRYSIINTSNEGFCILDDNKNHVAFSWFKMGWKLTGL